MSELLYNIFNSQIFAVLAVVWLIVCIANQNAQKSLLSRLSILVSKPIIFKGDENPNEYAFYPRRILEQIAIAFREVFTYPLDVVIEQFRSWIKLQISLAYRSGEPMRMVGYFIYLAFFILFAWANAISIVTSLDILHIFEGQIPQILTSFEVAVFMGTLGSVVTAGLILMDIQSSHSVLSNWDEHGGYWRTTARMIATFIIILAAMIVIALGLQRLVTLGWPADHETLITYTNFAIVVLVPLNNILSIVLISYEAILGVLVVFVAIQMPLLGIMYVLNYILKLLGIILPLLLDTLCRFVLLVLDLVFYVISTPINTIIGTPIKILERIIKR